MNFSKILGWFSLFLVTGFLGLIIIKSEIFFGEQICNSGFENFWEEVTEKQLSENQLSEKQIEAENKLNEELEFSLWMRFDDSLPKCQKLLIENCGNEGKIQHQISKSLNSCYYNSAKPENFNSEKCVDTLLLFKEIGIDIEDKVKELDTKIISKDLKEQLFNFSYEVTSHKNFYKIQDCKKRIMRAEKSCARNIKPNTLKKQETEPLRACTGSETIMYGIKFFTFNIIRAVFRAF